VLIVLLACAGFDNVDKREGALHRSNRHHGRDVRQMSRGSAPVSEAVLQLASKHRATARSRCMSNGHLYWATVQKSLLSLQLGAVDRSACFNCRTLSVVGVIERLYNADRQQWWVGIVPRRREDAVALFLGMKSLESAKENKSNLNFNNFKEYGICTVVGYELWRRPFWGWSVKTKNVAMGLSFDSR